ncbi:MAG: hypothetical protein A2504_06900 [Bdellovibrionales bacterium RIFOXYD12_FULL_39_22]|nr:MAG: hypothetical protein A2385_09220 [Bdellovibrionales bacterium RIFOXYB1_FULL_39_21]OFZ45122.1 MAG: hypothetical protein A2485_05320 [Bdellovibrionales bacterium RIFOXYC12_FULL_39_17]OFZ45686.1 MAG: hypothetical protein A2404_03800 [Bdellovibrionales bacterium RIFOXYC1_FULL_39_130]OFZ77548.1 MAG: hypothetical protein A2560_09385 [Bdellovibrionales bacterium RIFOXYD1_FULL_39_84]OFZ91677.1 MAG: hypothetical protein A2504_06900 [Bdellovibrionales bacterium RIFOXYD12_FULL_39_22]HLE11858.1 hy
MENLDNISQEDYVTLTIEALDACPDYIDKMIFNIKKINSSYDENKYQDANKFFEQLTIMLEEFVQLISHIKISIQSNSDQVVAKNQDVVNVENHFLGIIKALIPAKEKNDIIMLCDLLVYELVDNLTLWKEITIPHLRQMLK